ncbi:hypothetical protein WJ80_07710 [Burkholderia ubonensis]|nr:hypothetical protein WJ80_07710 [Burkholderia ubonensis]
MQSELVDLRKSAPGRSNQSDEKAKLRRKIFAKKAECEYALGQQIAAKELEKKLADATAIDAQELVRAFANEPFPADLYPTGSANVLIGYYEELSDLAKKLTNSGR